MSARAEEKTGRDEASFAIGSNDRIVSWNDACERLLGISASDAVGRACWDVMGGRDVHGNLYCYRNCPISFAARRRPSLPIRGTVLDIVPGGALRRVQISTQVLPGTKPGVPTIVHVLKDPGEKPEERDVQPADGNGSSTPVRRETRGALTAREREILRCLAEGLETHDIASTLDISPVTVRNHVARVLTKLGVHTKLSAVVFAYRHGLLSPDQPSSADGDGVGGTESSGADAAPN